MNKFIIISAVAFSLCFTAMAQDEPATQTNTEQTENRHQTRRYYAEIVNNVSGPSHGGQISLQLGKIIADMTGLSANDIAKINRTLHFSSFTDMMNRMSMSGWRLESTYVTSDRTSSSVHWVISKDVVDPIELLTGLIDTKK